MFKPKCNLINKLYNPRNDILSIRRRIDDWIRKFAVDDITDTLTHEQFNRIFEMIDKYDQSDESVFLRDIMSICSCDICRGNPPSSTVIGVQCPFYQEVLIGWNLFSINKKLEQSYPRVYREIMVEMINQRREDDTRPPSSSDAEKK